jgi:hypothetical protein
MEWLFNVEHWLMTPAIPLWLVLLIVMTWSEVVEVPKRLRLIRQAKPEEKKKHYFLPAATVVGAGLLLWMVVIAIRIATQNGVN